MGEHISSEQVEEWLDEDVVQDVQRVSDDETEFNFQLRLARLPLHIIKEETWGPLRLVSKNAFDTDRTMELKQDDRSRQELLARIGPVLAATPGFYTFLDEEGISCDFAEAHSIQLEHRIYPDGASQQATMEGLMNLATAVRYLQNTIAVMLQNQQT
ncbi:hypothetical protein SAMN05421858_1611 [Haladaptatus litoreus]|uniref:Sensory transduction regulator n=1 Tax=Haladaptatus litoreus TaxID=553468 RepID=A0A1N6YKG4_9EURY|nr:hypothetical protein [Haladaptatus litoreus]SIR15093.1 hypothetical protein SAMN05421858_1611 [Haladaptatus litoreus]